MHKLKVGDLVQAELSGGRVVEATVMAVINKTDGTRLQVSFGHETALIYLWQVVKTTARIPLHGSTDKRISELSVKTSSGIFPIDHINSRR